jgi:hypothetical protein
MRDDGGSSVRIGRRLEPTLERADCLGDDVESLATLDDGLDEERQERDRPTVWLRKQVRGVPIAERHEDRHHAAVKLHLVHRGKQPAVDGGELAAQVPERLLGVGCVQRPLGRQVHVELGQERERPFGDGDHVAGPELVGVELELSQALYRPEPAHAVAQGGDALCFSHRARLGPELAPSIPRAIGAVNETDPTRGREESIMPL